jgi:hypothetical protein
MTGLCPRKLKLASPLSANILGVPQSANADTLVGFHLMSDYFLKIQPFFQLFISDVFRRSGIRLHNR